jgi:hypothetical protein
MAGSGIYGLDVQFLENIGNNQICGGHTLSLAPGPGGLSLHGVREGLRAGLKGEQRAGVTMAGGIEFDYVRFRTEGGVAQNTAS